MAPAPLPLSPPATRSHSPVNAAFGRPHTPSVLAPPVVVPHTPVAASDITPLPIPSTHSAHPSPQLNCIAQNSAPLGGNEMPDPIVPSRPTPRPAFKNALKLRAEAEQAKAAAISQRSELSLHGPSIDVPMLDPSSDTATLTADAPTFNASAPTLNVGVSTTSTISIPIPIPAASTAPSAKRKRITAPTAPETSNVDEPQPRARRVIMQTARGERLAQEKAAKAAAAARRATPAAGKGKKVGKAGGNTRQSAPKAKKAKIN